MNKAEIKISRYLLGLNECEKGAELDFVADNKEDFVKAVSELWDFFNIID